jgi:ring-1,2-phenylacetyl-CoA epoxidase subunit PaaD
LLQQSEIYKCLATVADPEVPVLSILDLGIVREVIINEQDEVTIIITPTYSGCPAMDVIAMQIRFALLAIGVLKVSIQHQLSPAWTTDWMSDEGKEKLRAYGIAPPHRKSTDTLALFEEEITSCPKCGSPNTEMTSQFGATSCKALYRCCSCQEPFEYFKCH